MGVTHHQGRLFITMPRRRVGIPATLNFINLNSTTNGQSPLLRGFPDYATNTVPVSNERRKYMKELSCNTKEWFDELEKSTNIESKVAGAAQELFSNFVTTHHRHISKAFPILFQPNNAPNPDRIFSVYRTRVDACNRLWFIDTGLLEYPDNRVQVQQPSIWIIDLATNQRLHRFEIPATVVARGNGVASITVDVDENSCSKAFAYIPDLANYRLYVYSLERNHMWSFAHNYFHFDPVNGDFDVAGLQFQWDDGIFSLTLGPTNSRGFRTAYFHSMAAITEFTVSTQVLRNETNAGRSNHGRDFKLLGHRQVQSQSTMHDYDEGTGVIFYAEVGRNAIGCWNTRKQFAAKNHVILHQDDARMIYPSDLSVDRDGTLWVMSNTMPRFIYASLNENEFNFRVWKGSAEDVIQGTDCAN